MPTPSTQVLTITAPRSGAAFLPDVKEHVENLHARAPITLASVGGTASAFTATATPTPAALVDGMEFWFTPNATPSAGATLNISSLGAKNLATPDGTNITAGAMVSGSRYKLVYDGTKLRVQTAELKADKARTISTAGLATGGGDLSADRTITVTAASSAEVVTGTEAGKAVTPSALTGAVAAGQRVAQKGSDIASASSINLGAATGDYVDVTGTTTITALGTVAAGIERTVRFTGVLTLTHNATSLILPGGANITTAAGDVATFRSLGSGNWRCVGYQPASAAAIPAGSAAAIAGTATNRFMTPADDKAALDERLQGATFISLARESGYLGAITDSAGRACLLIAIDGTVTGKIRLGSAVVGYTNLDTTLTPLIAVAHPVESGYAYAIVDAAGRIAFGIRPDGSVSMRVSALTGKAVAEANLVDALARQVMPRTGDLVAVMPDRWRARMGEVGVLTAAGDGSLWETFPSRPLRLLRGLNNSGQSIDVRRSAGLLMVGRSYVGTWSPGSYPSTSYKGSITSSAPSTPSGTFVAGDYYLYAEGAGATSTGTYAGMKVGDALVYDGSAWQIQAAPGTFGSRNRGGWWAVTGAGTFNGLTYAVGDRILYVGRQAGGGGAQFERWYKLDHASKGDLAYRGEFAPGSGMPASPSNGEVYQASASGSAGGFTWAAGDYALYIGGGWQQVPNTAATTYASGASIALACTADAAEWEVRRTDKSASVVGVRLQAQVQSMPRRHQDRIWLLSDSMFGVSGVGQAVLTALGRDGKVDSYGGGTSRDVLSMMEWQITQGDDYRGAVLVAWHGQNNQPSISESNAVQIREASLRMAALLGSRDRRHLFLSVLGQRTFTWNGSRLVCAQHEDQFAGTGALWELERWYAAAFPGQWLSPRLALLAAAGSTPDPQFPGMTEAQVASTYGIVPLSFFSGTLPVAAASLVYQGTRSTAGLPTGGSANDYYIRTANGTIGALLINVSGTWQEWTWDATHLSSAGAAALSTAIASTITANSW
jgi:hypothetical protein